MIGVIESRNQTVHSICRKVKGQDQVEDQQAASGAGYDINNGLFNRFVSQPGHKILDNSQQRLLKIPDGNKWYDGEQKNHEGKNGQENRKRNCRGPRSNVTFRQAPDEKSCNIKEGYSIKTRQGDSF